MSLIKEKSIEELKSQIGLIELIGDFVKLEKKGNTHVGLCPFHEEKTPSFHVSETGKFIGYKCQGCGKGGNDIFKFLQDYGAANDFRSAVHEAARLKNKMHLIQYEEGNRTPEQIEAQKKKSAEKESIFIHNQRVWEKFRELYPFQEWPLHTYTTDAKGELYFDIDCFGRGYLPETIEHFGLCIAPDSNWLVKHGEKAGFSKDILLKGDLIAESKNEKGGLYDRFRGRLLFPIYMGTHTKDRRAKIAGFGGRVNPSDPYREKKAKYVNSGDTPTYKKSKTLYGIFQNGADIKNARSNGLGYLVEGYTDVITPWENGVRNIAGKCGTALTIEQAKLMKKHAKEWILVPDVDPKFENGKIKSWPGLESTKKDVALCIEVGILPSVLVMPIRLDKKKDDVDSFFRRHGKKGWDEMLKNNPPQDGLLWLISEILKEGDRMEVKNRAMEMATDLLAKIQNEFVRKRYLKQLSSAKYLHIDQPTLSSLVLAKQIKEEDNYDDDRPKLSAEQENDQYRYQIHIGNWRRDRGKVFMKLDKVKRPVPLANFFTEGIYHVRSESNPARKIKIVNEEGFTQFVDLHTDVFEDFSNFKKAVAALGNFKFKSHCKNEDFCNIVSKLYDEMPTVYRVTTLGTHSMSFYTWSNGIILNDGRFVSIKENGTIEINGETFKLPGKDIDEEQRKRLDDFANVDAHVEQFVHVEGDCPSFHDIAQLFCKVHGRTNGPIALAYFLLCLYRSVIYPDYTKEFPILNGVGPPQQGKSALWWSLVAFFGFPRKPVNLHSVTKASFAAVMEQFRDALVGLDEFKNNLHPEKHELLKSLSDGVGRTRRANLNNRKSTENTEVLSGVYLFGQDLPTHDIALLTRCITLWFRGYDNSPEAIAAFNELKDLEKTGRLSQITGMLQQYRKDIKKEIATTFSHVKSELRGKLKIDVRERIINAHAWPLAVVFILQDKVKFPELEKGKTFYESLMETAVELTQQQMSQVNQEDEKGEFFRILMALSLKGIDIKHRVHILVDIQTDLSVSNQEDHFWEKPRKILYVSLSRCFDAYKKEGRLQNQGSLREYLQQSKYYLGNKKKKFGKAGVLSVMCFDLGEIENHEMTGGLSETGIQFMTSKEALAKMAREAGGESEEEKKEDEKEDGSDDITSPNFKPNR